MPVYVFECPKCRNKFEKLLPMTPGKCKNLAHCPECGEIAKQVMAPCNYQFSLFLKELSKGTII